MPEPKPGSDEVLKVVFMVNKKADQNYFKTVSSSIPLSSIIQDLIERYKLTGAVNDYALVIQKSDKLKEYKIVTEKNKCEMNANIVELSDSPAIASQKILQKISDVTTDSKDLETVLKDLKDMSVDATFSAEFIAQKGLEVLMKGVSTKFRVNELGLVLHSVQSLLEHEISDAGDQVDGVTNITEPDTEFIKQLADLTCKESKEPTWSLAIRCGLMILAMFVRENKARDVIDQHLAFPNLISLLGHNDVCIQLASLGLINSLLASLGQDRKRDMVRCLHEKTARFIIIDHLLTKDKDGTMANQLYQLQYHMLSLLHTRLHTPMQPMDSNSIQKIKDLRSIAFDTGSPGLKKDGKYNQDYTKLGFKNNIDPSNDFMNTPPGILALDCMEHFAKQHQEKYMKVVLENSCRQDNHECPFVESSCELVTLLAEILGVGKPQIPNNTRYHEMFFKVEQPFEEFYSYCIVILNKTWRDMRATRLDFTKVLDVVREQLEASLMPDNIKERPKTFDQFRCNVKSYAEISKKWQSDAKSRDAWEKSKPVAELRQHLQVEIEELIRQQRENYIVEGTRFNRIKKTGEQVKSQYKYVKLHTNQKTIYVGDWNHDKTVPTIDDLEPRLYVADIRDIKTGLNCEFIKDYKKEYKEQYTKLALSLIGDNVSLLDLVAPDEQAHNYWVDGLNSLLRRQMDSPDYHKERTILTNTEIKLRLLDLEGVDLPTEAPPIPDLPSDFNFASC